MEPNKLSLLAYNKVKDNNESENVPEVVENEVKEIADKKIKKGLLKGWRKNKKPEREQITIRDGNLMTPTTMRKQLRKYYEGVNDDHHNERFYRPGALTFLINLKNTREKNYTDGFMIPSIHDHEEVDEFFRETHVDYERLINDTINEMTKDELIKFYNNVFFSDQMLWSDIPKEDNRHTRNPRYFKQEEEEEPIPRFVVDGVLAARKRKQETKSKRKSKSKHKRKNKSKERTQKK